jgi:hypothetical protein
MKGFCECSRAFAKDSSANIPQSILPVLEKFVRGDASSGNYANSSRRSVKRPAGGLDQKPFLAIKLWFRAESYLFHLILIPLMLFLVEVEWFFLGGPRARPTVVYTDDSVRAVRGCCPSLLGNPSLHASSS